MTVSRSISLNHDIILGNVGLWGHFDMYSSRSRIFCIRLSRIHPAELEEHPADISARFSSYELFFYPPIYCQNNAMCRTWYCTQKVQSKACLCCAQMCRKLSLSGIYPEIPHYLCGISRCFRVPVRKKCAIVWKMPHTIVV
jgi:hypothetical protein